MDGYLFMETQPDWVSGIQDLDPSEFPPPFPITFHISQVLDEDTEPLAGMSSPPRLRVRKNLASVSRPTIKGMWTRRAETGIDPCSLFKCIWRQAALLNKT